MKDLQIIFHVPPEFHDPLFFYGEHRPDYGKDELHNARLIGAYHAYKGAGLPGVYKRWYEALDFWDARYIDAYTKAGEWGRTDLPSGPSRIKGPLLTGAGAAIDGELRRAVEYQFGLDQAQSAAPRARIDEPVSSDRLDAMAWGFRTILKTRPASFEESLILVSRIRLRAGLESCGLPAPWVCGLVKRLPAWALPAVAWYRLERVLCSFGL